MQTTTPPSSGEQLWKQCLQIIAGSCDPQTLQRWFAPIRPLGIETREVPALVGLTEQEAVDKIGASAFFVEDDITYTHSNTVE